MDAREAEPEGMTANPMSAGSFRSMDEMKASLIQMGPIPETYDRLLDLVGEKDKDSAKDALANFFQGSATALCFLYQLLIRSGKANAVDEALVAEIAQMHPESNEKVAGLWIPDPSSGLGTKTASGGVGGPNSGCSYTMHGPDDMRMCPKLQNAISTFICRYHCLDGLMIDDNQVLCGEAIWRQSIMDKFSRDFKDADGKWTGGYLRNRFVIEQNTESNDYQLKPNERARPIKESAWSTEKRLQEMRKDLGEKRGYQGVYEPEDAYNFDPHELAKGPKNVQLDAKERDKIAKNSSSSKAVKIADSMVDQWVGSPGSESNREIQELAKQDPREFMQEPVDLVDLKNQAMSDGVDQDQMIALVQGGQAEDADFVLQGGLYKLPSNIGSKAFNLTKKIKAKTTKPFNLSKIAMDMTPSVSKCNNPQCPSHGAHREYTASGICPVCGQKTLKHMSKEQVTQTSGGIEKEKSPMQMMASVTFANGAYQAEKNGTKAFGSTKEEALQKLALMLPEKNSLDKLDPGSADEQSRQIKEILTGNPEQPEQPEQLGNPEQFGNPKQPEPQGDTDLASLPVVPTDDFWSGEDSEPLVTDDMISEDIENTQRELTPDELSELEAIETAAGAGPDPKSDLQ